MNHRNYSPGFTLVELLVALFVFSLVTVFAYRAVHLLGNSLETQSSEQDELAELERGLSFFSKEAVGAVKVIDTSVSTTQQQVESILTLSVINSAGAPGETNYFFQGNSVLRENVRQGDSGRLQLLNDLGAASVNLYTGNPVYADEAGTGGEKRVIGMQLEVMHNKLGKVVRYVYLENNVFDQALNTLDAEVGGGTSAGGTVDFGNNSASGNGNADGDSGNEPATPSTPVYDPLGGDSFW